MKYSRLKRFKFKIENEKNELILITWAIRTLYSCKKSFKRGELIPTTYSSLSDHLSTSLLVKLVLKFRQSKILWFQCRDNRNFHLLLVGLAIIDSILIVDLIIEVSIVGVFMQTEPKWYIITYPFIFHPFRGIIQTTAIFMVVAVTTERYRFDQFF